MQPASHVLRKPKDLILGLIFLGIAAGVLIYARQYDMGTTRQMGPGYLPTALGLLLGGFGALLVGTSFFGELEPAEPPGIRASLFVLTGVALFGLLIRPAGLIVSILVLVVVAGLAYRSRKPLPLLIYAACLAAACVIVFPWMLGQQIPVLGSWFAR
jgi:hypothetical protein